MSDDAMVNVLVDCLIEQVRFFERCDGIMDPDLAQTNLEAVAWRVNEFLDDDQRRELAALIRARAAAEKDPAEREWASGIPTHLGLDDRYHTAE